jgi:hypothetical protein
VDLHFTRAGAPIEIAMFTFLVFGSIDSLERDFQMSISDFSFNGMLEIEMKNRIGFIDGTTRSEKKYMCMYKMMLKNATDLTH